jgi:hypothetical protein
LLRSLNLTFRFLLELLALAALGAWGATRSGPVPLRAALTVGAPLSAAVWWGLLVSPKARFGGPRALRLALGLPVFLLAAAAITGLGRPRLALGFVIVTTLNTLFTWWSGPQPGETSPD